MGIYHKDGYSAEVEGFFVVTKELRFRLAKSNGCTFVLAESCELPPGTEGDLLVIVDGKKDSRRVVLRKGVSIGQTTVEYEVVAPF
ncbi:MAG TPA: hypothetical protein VFE46_03300 [Pirellulales bacterium]|jgi:hypothetical protein|nr:hypothetical protein [Pirellulales bacterium]